MPLWYLSTWLRKISAVALSSAIMQSVCALKDETQGKYQWSWFLVFHIKYDKGIIKKNEIARSSIIPSISVYMVNCSMNTIDYFNCTSCRIVLVMKWWCFWKTKLLTCSRTTKQSNTWNWACYKFLKFNISMDIKQEFWPIQYNILSKVCSITIAIIHYSTPYLICQSLVY